MEDRYFKILELLSQHGIEQNVECQDFVDRTFYGIKEAEMHSYLSMMDTNGHIKFGDKGQILYSNPLYLAITLEGVDYLNSYYLKRATLQSYRNQKWINIITWAISCASIGIAVFFGLKSNLLESQVINLQKK